MKSPHNFWLQLWYEKSLWFFVLLPLSWCFRVIACCRKTYLIRFRQTKVSVPVIVIGNISVGGTGKTPLIITLVEYLKEQGYSPGVVSRGYGGNAPFYPYLIDQASTASQSGDEPLLIYKATGCAVCVAPDRVAAAQELVKQGCDIILSDDGLQHYRLARSLEIAVVDGQRLFGNGQCLPVGPLREPVSRLNSVDMVVINNAGSAKISKDVKSFSMTITPLFWRQVQSYQQFALDEVSFLSPVNAIAGIGNPQRFFKTLDDLSVEYCPHEFPDHHQFSVQDLQFSDQHCSIVMTEKDAVKCQEFAGANCYALVVRAQLNDDFWHAFNARLLTLMSR